MISECWKNLNKHINGHGEYRCATSILKLTVRHLNSTATGRNTTTLT